MTAGLEGRDGAAGQPAPTPRIAAVILAAGQSSRMGCNKLLLDVGGDPMIRRTVNNVLASGIRPVITVLGHEADAVNAVLGESEAVPIVNRDYRQGLSTSLRQGIAALPADVDGAIICLGDMPGVGPGLISRMVATFNPAEGRAVIVPIRAGRRGNPVLWGRRFFPALMALSGDVGARYLIEDNTEWLVGIDVEDDAALIDLDTPKALTRWLECGKPDK